MSSTLPLHDGAAPADEPAFVPPRWRWARKHPTLLHFFCYSEPREQDQADAEGFISQQLLSNWLPEQRDLDAYFLGPKPFMAQVKRLLRELGVPEKQCHYEFFGPASALEA